LARSYLLRYVKIKLLSKSILKICGTGNTSPPTPRHSHSAVVYEDSMYVFGGYDGHYRNDFYRFNFVTGNWS